MTDSKTCQQCGQSFTKRAGSHDWPQRRFCGRGCATRWTGTHRDQGESRRPDRYAYLTPTARDPHWRDHAACSNVDPELFFHPDGRRADSDLGKRQVARAKTICVDCPVRRDCLATALASHAVGIWGGTDDAERALLRTVAAKGAA